MRHRVRAYCELVRVPNLFTAIADVLAGFLYLGGGLSDWRIALSLALSSACLYGGGVALNDLCDVDRDRRERPQRPIASGRISSRSATVLVAILLLAGVVLAATISALSGILAAGLLVTIVLYDMTLKSTRVAPGLMGICRTLNVALGMSFAGSLRLNPATAIPLVAMWVYITSVTHFARTETAMSHRNRLVAGTIGVCMSVASLSLLFWVLPDPHAGYLGLVLLLVAMLGIQGRSAISNALPQVVQRSAGIFIVALILFDTCIAWAERGVLCGAVVAACLLPTLALKRGFRVT